MQGPGSPKAEAPQVTGYLSSQLQDCEKRYKSQPREWMTKILPAAGPGSQTLAFAWADVQGLQNGVLRAARAGLTPTPALLPGRRLQAGTPGH